MSYGRMMLCHTFTDNAYIELSGADAKFWAGEGLPVYEGGLDGFVECYPEYAKILLDRGIIKPQPDDDPAPM